MNDAPESAPTLLRTRPVRTGPIGRGTRLLNGRFELEDRLGGGGMGEVYQAIDLEAARLEDPHSRIALKVLGQAVESLPEARLGLQREASRARQLAHPNIVRVYEFYEDEGIVFTTMELLKGSPWDKLIRMHPHGLALDEARPLIEQLCAALAYAHSEGVVHSDLKPQNLFLTPEGRAKVLDFGIAAPLRSLRPERGETVYNPRRLGAVSVPYSCLEMWLGLDADPRDDVYSLGCIVYELLQGSHPFQGSSAAEAHERNLTPKPIKSLTDGQNRALAQALAFERRHRTSSVELFAAHFWQAQKSARSRRGFVWGAIAAAVAVATGTVWFSVDKPGPAEKVDAPPVQPVSVSGASAAALSNTLGMVESAFNTRATFTPAEVFAAVAHSPRRASLGSSDAKIRAAVELCKQSSPECKTQWYADEKAREVVLKPFALDLTPVSRRSFGRFTAATGYITAAERAKGTYALVQGRLRWVPGGSWKNAGGSGAQDEDVPVVAVDYDDALRYCQWAGERLPTEDEWEYVARGPSRHAFAWGDNPTSSDLTPLTSLPAVTEGPTEGIGGLYHGLTGSVWQWVDTQTEGRQVLKGASWLEHNPANQRAAARRSELPTRTDSDTGFRCARSVSEWPDAQFWIASSTS